MDFVQNVQNMFAPIAEPTFHFLLGICASIVIMMVWVVLFVVYKRHARKKMLEGRAKEDEEKAVRRAAMEARDAAAAEAKAQAKAAAKSHSRPAASEEE